ncbi:YbaB/EbfC family nucleoid-associated protein [Acuticoccus sp. MNP-M23]|uniref:YbaB/EbfC family nucleoid-associated protein n=1 Tax=Acuticoccus sp. MNP-M23 TaxID=3072793 RepID=UPI0028159B38|nr:YbaB/EbfC family nucleoid-associated protein [Acuticoccus sp. MNP-M23]WMS41057.1 YbaB/EbfC family nucleoid-associated protein [Acuticoccus sp. MNP-M23]
MDILKMMGKAREIQSRMGELQEEMKTLEATGESGAGAVVARVNGQMALVSLKIDPAMLKPEEAEIVEDLVIAACNDAREKVGALVQERTQGMMGDMGLPAGFKLPFG